MEEKLSTQITRSPRAGIVLVESQALRLSQAIAAYQQDQVTWLITQLTERGFGDLTPTHVSFLSSLDCADNYASQIARKLNLSRQAVHKTVTELSRLGFVESVPNRVKRNSKVIQITAQGEALIAAARLLYAELDKNLTENCSHEEIESLIDLLGKQLPA